MDGTKKHLQMLNLFGAETKEWQYFGAKTLDVVSQKCARSRTTAILY